MKPQASVRVKFCVYQAGLCYTVMVISYCTYYYNHDRHSDKAIHNCVKTSQLTVQTMLIKGTLQ